MKKYFLKSPKLSSQGLLHIQMPKAHLEFRGYICRSVHFKEHCMSKTVPSLYHRSTLTSVPGCSARCITIFRHIFTMRTHFRTCTGFPESYLSLSVFRASYSLRLLWFLTLYFHLQPLCSAAGFPGWSCTKPRGLGYELHIQMLSFFK